MADTTVTAIHGCGGHKVNSHAGGVIKLAVMTVAAMAMAVMKCYR